MLDVRYEINLITDQSATVVNANTSAIHDHDTSVTSVVSDVSVVLDNSLVLDTSVVPNASGTIDITNVSSLYNIRTKSGGTSIGTSHGNITTATITDTCLTEKEVAGTDLGAKRGGVRYSIRKVQVKPGKTIDNSNNDELSGNYLARLPVLKEQAAPYTPMPYVFRVNTVSNKVKVQNMWGRCPPFHLLLDHAIAVIWLLFANKEYDCPLGISQLQWALAFLKTIHTKQGDHPKDVQTCIDTIENLLLNQYAELAEELPNVSKLNETVNYIDGALASQSVVVQSIPFSLNYNEMINKCPAVAFKESKLSMTSAEAKEELENIKKAAGVQSYENLDSVSKHRAINVLKAWKTEQLNKIRGELRRLRSIEDKMKDIDENFDGYLEDDLELLYKK